MLPASIFSFVSDNSQTETLLPDSSIGQTPVRSTTQEVNQNQTLDSTSIKSLQAPIQTSQTPNPFASPGRTKQVLEGINPLASPSPSEDVTFSVTPIPEITDSGIYPSPQIPNSPTFSSGTSTSEGAYPGPLATFFFTPGSTFVFQTPSFTTQTGTPFPLVQTPSPIRTPIPPPAWITSDLRASNIYSVKLNSGKVQLVEFFAFWDGASQAMAPLVHEIEKRYQDRMNFVYLDIDDPATDKFMKELGYKIQPHFFLIGPQGEIIQQWVGYVKVEELIEAVESVIG